MMHKWLFSLEGCEDEIVKIIAQSFSKNKRISSIFNGHRKSFSNGIHMLITYAYLLVKKIDGVFSSHNKTSIIFYYQNSQLKKSLLDKLRYVYMVIFIIGITRVKTIRKREQKIKNLRTEDQKKSGHIDFLYVWFLAQAKTYNAIDALMETKRFIMNKAELLKLPIYMETTEYRLVPLYARMGFKFYDSHIESDYTIYFAKYEPNLYKISNYLVA